jgi:Fe-S-cluster containining protein
MLTIDTIFSSLTEKQTRMLKEMSEHYRQEWARIKDKKQALRAFYKAIDESNTKFNERGEPAVTCKKGCSFCCNIKVEATQIEIDVIVDYMAKKKIKVSQKQLEGQVPLTVENHFMSPFRKCVFLDDQGSCKIYEVRPFVCRNYFSVGDPKECDPDEHPKGGVTTTMNYETFAIYTAVINEYLSNSFSLLLLNTLKKKYGFFR